ncbi:hypothetical protein PAXRUDRAFT_826201 [Paxillus rubicundulus Ve08.2h10]|uniref:Uncharacterized protein n=1 Tax=Paxillus rubicundulus Ve08.2h10 TaxID=930991 RepID=A0A0D0DS81_9AGAM|nr:hypothetical protein PAXRUDRAFT_826201 [Paxillus rubicundulus Ve08.2h10]
MVIRARIHNIAQICEERARMLSLPTPRFCSDVRHRYVRLVDSNTPERRGRIALVPFPLCRAFLADIGLEAVGVSHRALETD